MIKRFSQHKTYQKNILMHKQSTNDKQKLADTPTSKQILPPIPKAIQEIGFLCFQPRQEIKILKIESLINLI